MKLWLSLVIFLCSSHLMAQDNEIKTKSEAPPAPFLPDFKVNVDLLHYDFQGRHPADGNIYGFEGVTFTSETSTFTWMMTPLWQLSLALQYVEKYAETEFLGTLYKDRTQGLGDTRLSTSRTFLDGTNIYIVNAGISLPTGSVGEKNKNNPSINYPYNMQLGSGTYDPFLSIMGIKTMGRHQVGLLGMGTFRTGRNDFGYRMGDEYLAKTWYTFNFRSYFAPGLWLNYNHIQRITGQDRTFGRNLFVQWYHSPRDFWDLSLNINSTIKLGKHFSLKGLVGRPIWQESKNIDNVQVYAQWFAQVGMEARF